jgi:hypothetical protein
MSSFPPSELGYDRQKQSLAQCSKLQANGCAYTLAVVQRMVRAATMALAICRRDARVGTRFWRGGGVSSEYCCLPRRFLPSHRTTRNRAMNADLVKVLLVLASLVGTLLVIAVMMIQS